MDESTVLPFFGREPSGVYDCREGCMLYFYENTTENDFASCIAKLQSDGFSLLQKHETDGNLFACLTRECQVTLLYTPCDATIRLTVSSEKQTPLLKESGECEGEGETKFIAFENDHTLIDCGMCLMVQCPDDSFFVVDSGHYFQFNDNDRIYRFLRERTPEGKKVVINGWFITHAHTDHISKLMDFLKYNTRDVIIEGFYQNLLPIEYMKGRDNHEENEVAAKLMRQLEAYPAPVYKLHTGMRFAVRNLVFDVLYTHEDAFPEHIEDYNDSSTVLMLHAEGTNILIPGDAALLASSVLEKRYTRALKCDIVQVSHHGHTGLSADCYEKTAADCAVFPVTKIMFDGDMEKLEATRRVVELSSEHYITSDGTIVIPLPYRVGNVRKLPDETFEDFEKIKRLWRYVYTDERKNELYERFLANGGNEEELLLPSSCFGWIEPKPPIEE